MSNRDAWVPPTASSDPTTTSLTTTNASQSAAGANQAYQPPTSSYQSAFETVGGGGGGAGPVVNYRCGECNAQVPLSAADAVRCKECGHRVLYKERTKRMVQFEAR
ncbi:MAG: hypothetical protein Q9160_000967 [Pyrenula sp. 1 TL-2023]